MRSLACTCGSLFPDKYVIRSDLWGKVTSGADAPAVADTTAAAVDPVDADALDDVDASGAVDAPAAADKPDDADAPAVADAPAATAVPFPAGSSMLSIEQQAFFLKDYGMCLLPSTPAPCILSTWAHNPMPSTGWWAAKCTCPIETLKFPEPPAEAAPAAVAKPKAVGQQGRKQQKTE